MPMSERIYDIVFNTEQFTAVTGVLTHFGLAGVRSGSIGDID
jgi:hypothetical protein